MTLRIVSELPSLRRDPIDARTLGDAARIVEDVRARGVDALREHAERLGDLPAGAPLVIDRASLRASLASLPAEQRALLERTAGRIGRFAAHQREAFREMTAPIQGGTAGHTLAPVERAGCYAPGGRFPLPSTALMTAVTARAAGVREIWVASPRPTAITCAAAAIAGADALLAVGGAHAIAALAYGAGPIPACDTVVGPGNRWVTAAKKIVAGDVGIDALAGPSELVVVADDATDPALVAADLLAQAEHDPDAVPILVSLGPRAVARIHAELERQLADLPTAETARTALDNGFAIVASSLDDAVRICDALAPEHLELCAPQAAVAAGRFRHYGALFVGSLAAEVLGDYGAGPNHVLPTGRTARFTGGLSVLTFLRVRTWMRMDEGLNAAPLLRDAAELARMEGLEAHARAAERRLGAGEKPHPLRPSEI
jgi:phosphoribosyl-ATP pyrophosphohydrolase/phosphoribosyl-AMP cyclohydrolase/histidinol dehydrogenase